MSEMTLFKGNSLVNSALFAKLKDLNKKLAGSSGGRRISLRGKKFRMMSGGEQVSVSKEDWLNIVVIDAAAVHRTYYKGTYSSEDTQPPVCWSLDTEAPAPEVKAENRQADRCADCPMNVRGSGQGETRACRFSQRLAIALEGELDKVYQLQLPAMSIFGDAKNGHMPLQAYTRFIDAHDMPIVALVTKMYFDDDADVPKVYFSPVRPLEEAELEQVLKARDLPETKRAVELIVAQTDDVEGAPTPKARPAAKPAAKAAPADDEEEAPKPKAKPATKAAPADDEELDEPKRAPSKKAPVEVVDNNLADLVDEWDDD